ncbi:hypothetical protein [Loktanella sp. Alg231-35]|uniref:hypothetical protein n=1 Tax=Loktanella sp. Alg231-35 TaxID=1922220 RepID=UPI000D54E968|nr:hypothetical protein [Loktanella sp. Alg231-35]
MKPLAIIANILIPGVGSFIIGKVGAGVAQIVIWGFGLMLTLGTLGIGGIIGLPLMLGAWIWAIVTAAGGNQPVQVTVVNKQE